MRTKLTAYLLPLLVFVVASSTVPVWTAQDNGDHKIIDNDDGATLGYSPSSGIEILTVDSYAFKDLNRNGQLDPYEDWRLSTEERAKDLASKMSIEQIAGLMLYSGHQAIPSTSGGFGGPSTYDGKTYKESAANPWDLTDQQKKFLTEDNLRHVLITSVESPEVAARWNNTMQAYVEGLGLGIPSNTSSDPRHGSDSYAEYNAGAGGDISMWPGTLGIAATFDPQLMRKFGEIASREYRALGITTALSPQIDLATEPRWSRFDGTMGEDPELATDMARAYVDGFQYSKSSEVVEKGWGYQSVNAMVKHWPGGGAQEGGRDAHYAFGSYAVYPGDNLEDHLQPFTEGAFNLEGETGAASAAMPYYTISHNRDTVYNENVGNAYSKYMITDLLRERYNYDGVVCTDWLITADAAGIDIFSGKPWGVENLTVAERHYEAIKAGVDQFGGNNEMGPVLEAYQMGVKEFGEEYMRKRFQQSAVRLLQNSFRTGLFENPYVDVAHTKKTVGSPEFMKEGYQAQLRSIVMLKNSDNTLPLENDLKVYIPQRYIPEGTDWFGNKIPERWEDPVSHEIAEDYFEVVDSPDEADFALVSIESPQGGDGYSGENAEQGGNGYMPISLQYQDYTAEHAREESIAGGSPFEDFTNRSYKGKTVSTHNSYDLQMVNETREKMGDKPVIVAIKVNNPMVFDEFEQNASAILIHSGVQDQALMDIITGEHEPSGLLPFQMPASMKTVEEQYEDVPRDMKPYTDSEGHTYDFGFGLNWDGVIKDERVKRYVTNGNI
ncbi:glycoside hydrolase family 3 protein [Aliifodinibius sp. S!AR15-10]|uniref:glycoside hydrolase family 3 protein n=1 Tax=Aliifodinibius sp. S!AR15-10 TaxID=2950437 RepID=UPI00285549EB|nr:glycoside hydrolase family 3 N-terminal domain-containing protein [Aliifodinibius sp. S!AR15-10]MDR8393074.1 glycoside hydrolase family 3 protein [Aliifodinibius sp. S!AR15-10]